MMANDRKYYCFECKHEHRTFDACIYDRQKEDYYCENCYREHLEHYVIDNVGSVFCSIECFGDFYASDDDEHEIVDEV